MREIKRLGEADIAPAMRLAGDVFDAYVAPDYDAQGIAAFRAFIDAAAFREKMAAGGCRVWGCFVDSRLAGVVATMDRKHISLLFVDGFFHGQGIGGELVAVAAHDCALGGASAVTVNSSRYAVPVYRALGFSPAGPEQTLNGIIFTPMRRALHVRGTLPGGEGKDL